jgi:hypothetical protein
MKRQKFTWPQGLKHCQCDTCKEGRKLARIQKKLNKQDAKFLGILYGKYMWECTVAGMESGRMQELIKHFGFEKCREIWNK